MRSVPGTRGAPTKNPGSGPLRPTAVNTVGVTTRVSVVTLPAADSSFAEDCSFAASRAAASSRSCCTSSLHSPRHGIHSPSLTLSLSLSLSLALSPSRPLCLSLFYLLIFLRARIAAAAPHPCIDAGRTFRVESRRGRSVAGRRVQSQLPHLVAAPTRSNRRFQTLDV